MRPSLNLARPHSQSFLMRTNLSFALNEEDDILNTTIRDSDTGSVMYTVKTPKHAEGILTTTVTRRNQINGSTRFAFSILWESGKKLEDVKVVLDNRTFDEVPVREILENAPGSTTYGSVNINDVEYRWKSKGTGSKFTLVTEDNVTVAESYSKRRSSFFRKARDMSLEISEVVALAVDVILLTFILVWRERQNEKLRSIEGLDANIVPLSPLPADD